ncbi:hypothetical protein SISNIDRAFT_470133 [Sistotremastrum niveocremeum HHB9708]|uniref:DUF7330 domain-containing protein n=1 Tax=Sistotremastrum niveocremeum HHB9708 TaxID=1314777 RepID=A0A164PA99_9AGAM|nr:hypothetical protein SISNIDRAFT_470133 [Sistotremastrum niveocremeum HHB9708]
MNDLKDFMNPPPYSQDDVDGKRANADAFESPTEITASTGIRTNFLKIQSEGDIKGSWGLDPSIHLPPLGVRPRVHPSLKFPWNLDIWSYKGNVEARINIVKGSHDNPRVAVMIWGQSSNVVRLTKEEGCPVWLDCASPGPLTVYIPRSFQGPFLTAHPRWDGQLTFGPGVENELTILREDAAPAFSSYFHGSYDPNEYLDARTWLGDVLSVGKGEKNTIRILYSD